MADPCTIVGAIIGGAFGLGFLLSAVCSNCCDFETSNDHVQAGLAAERQKKSNISTV